MTSADQQHAQKMQVAEAAVKFVRSDSVLGVGTGSTVNCFIEALAASGKRIEAAVSSSEASTTLLESHGIEVIDLNLAGTLDLYIDGADEFDSHRRLIKGGGGALTREKIVTAASRSFVCIVDESKKVGVLGRFPLPVEVIPMARSFVARQLVSMGGQPELRQGFVTDNGNVILDVHNMDLVDPVKMEKNLNNLPGVVTNGLWALRPADVVLMATGSGVKTFD
ncbi:MAG: ribose-5-phosphate isomerase RpiA [Xanthomonadales bacterium]|jgi:ribose 5-phosphate isomerase A|nr:ribose-5-phosphate isomerase RpiA [Xanthomonadales bacterium]MDH3923959.1 ribose-5-phosphate isomerase RpiA [Xanthomonadales bacterium]MDH3940569.1 ribose-5-phosphate isomerase RpiA [Xanthomonadales bacterium]MDH4002138.1 ribose-5-phosphate isomerase RpiA [Xanthomonadales bacterium]